MTSYYLASKLTPTPDCNAKIYVFIHVTSFFTISQYCNVRIFVFKFEQSSYLFSLKNSRPCWDLNRGPPGTKPICYQLSYYGLDHQLTYLLKKLHYNNNRCRADEIRTGPFSIPLKKQVANFQPHKHASKQYGCKKLRCNLTQNG